MSCIIKNCNSKSKDTTLFCIPIEKTLRLKWIEAIEKHQVFNHNASDPIFVCIHHFHPNDILPGARKRISAITVPTIFPDKSENKPANTVVVITRVSSQNGEINTLKRSMPPIGPISKVRKVEPPEVRRVKPPEVRRIEPLPQNNVSKDPDANSLVGKKIRLKIEDLKNLPTFTQVPNGSTTFRLMNNLVPAKNPAKMTDYQVQRVPLPKNLSIRPTSAIGKKIIIVPKKNVNPVRKESYDLPVIQQVYSLQTNTSLETTPNDNVLENSNSSNSIEQRLKVIDIDKLRQASTSSENLIEPISDTSHQADANGSNGYCLKCITITDKVNHLEKSIEKLQIQNKILKGELSKKKSANESTLNQRKNQYFNMSNKQCLLCKQFVEEAIADQHLCLRDQENVQCHICGLKYESTSSFVQHINTYHKYGHNTLKHTYKCDECDSQYSNPILFDCHKVSHQLVTPVNHNQQEIPAKQQIDKLTFANTNFFQCAICTASFVEARDLGQHIRQVHVKGSDFKCYSCGKLFEGSAQLEVHVQKVHKNIFECEICKPKLEILQDFHLVHGIHNKTENSETQISNECFDMPTFECYICKVKIQRVTDLRTHMEKHARDHECQICKLPCTQNELNSHLCGNEKKICCENCDETFTSMIKLLDHLKLSHEKKRLYRCHKCPKFFPMIILRHYHMMQHGNDAQLRKYPCNICGKRFTSLAYLYIHKNNHKRNRDYLCDECGHSFMTEKNLQNHKMSSVHNNQPHFRCPECPQQFFNKAHMQKHLERHQNIKYVCETCNMELRSKASYLKHCKIHTRTEADRRFECKACSMKFFSSKGLSKHRMVHNENRPHACQFCDVSYKYKGDLNKHLRLHLDGGKIHQCTMCPSSFYYPQELDDHIFDHYKKDKMNKEEKNDEKRDEKKDESNECISNNTLSPSVILKPAFVHDNIQLWG